MVVHDPDVCTCYECSLRSWEKSLLEEENMRSTRPRTVEVTMVRGVGEVPPFLGLFHRHFEKVKPATLDAKKGTFVAPVDLLTLINPRTSILNSIEEITVTYEKGA